MIFILEASLKKSLNANFIILIRKKFGGIDVKDFDLLVL
jgi:hypothetical protein